MKNDLKKIYNWIKANWFWLSYLVIFLFAFFIFAYLQYSNFFADPDSFYHAKAALLIRDGGIIKDFPWLQYTVLNETYTDQHFLYHVALIPFVTLMKPLIGTKLATVFLGTAFIMLFYWVLQRLKVRLAFLYPLLLLCINPFIFRISLAKAPSISLIFLLLGLYFIFNYRYKALFVLSFLYVWFYGGFILILLVTTIYIVVSIMYNRFFKRRNHNRFVEKLFSLLGRKHRQREKKRLHLKIFLASSLGVLAGLVINPYFPKNFIFYYHQLYKIGIINYSKIIGVGGEWYRYGFIDLISNTVVLSIVLVVTLVLFFILIKRQSKLSFTLFLICLLFFVFTLKSRRYVEYYIPFGMLFCAVSLSDSLRLINIKKYIGILKHAYFKNIFTKFFISLIIIYIIVVLPTVILRDLNTAKKDLGSGIAFDKFFMVSKWLENNSKAGSIVIHSDWDDFPTLFYHNSHNYYIVGLDPTFMYEYDKDLYWKWVNLTLGNEVSDLYNVVKNDFKASYILIEKDHAGMYNNVHRTEGFSLIYQDEQVYLFQVN